MSRSVDTGVLVWPAQSGQAASRWCRFYAPAVLSSDVGSGNKESDLTNKWNVFRTLMDDGTQGIYLVQHVQAADTMVVFDVIDYGQEPGTLKLVEDDAVPKFLGRHAGKKSGKKRVKSSFREEEGQV